MNREQQEAAVRRAYEEARFDERTEDEKGFAEIFEKRFKPVLVEGIGFNLDVLAARLRRKRVVLVMAAIVAVGFFPVAILLNGLETQRAFEVFVVAVVTLGIGGMSYAATKRADEEDPNHAAVVQAILERFGCRIGGLRTEDVLSMRSSPVRPEWSEHKALPETVVGRFDDHVAFRAMRVKAWRKDGKTNVTVFKGWHVAVDLPFEFSGTTVIRDRAARVTYEDGSGLRDADLEDPEFARRFVVQTDDQVEARVILAPDVMHDLVAAAAGIDRGHGQLLLAFSGSRAYVWLPWDDTALAVWRPLNPAALIEGIHGVFDELSAIRAFLRDIDVVAESEGFRAQAARNGRAGSS